MAERQYRAMEIVERCLGGVAFLALSGDLREDSTYHQGTLLDLVSRLVASGKLLIVLDLANVARIDALGLGEIAQAVRNARTSGADVKLLRPRPRVDRLLSVTKLRTVIDVCDCEEEVYSRTARVEFRTPPTSYQSLIA